MKYQQNPKVKKPMELVDMGMLDPNKDPMAFSYDLSKALSFSLPTTHSLRKIDKGQIEIGPFTTHGKDTVLTKMAGYRKLIESSWMQLKV